MPCYRLDLADRSRRWRWRWSGAPGYVRACEHDPGAPDKAATKTGLSAGLALISSSKTQQGFRKCHF